MGSMMFEYGFKKGFTLVDVIIAGAVISILIVATFPMISDFLMMQNEKEEEEMQTELARVLKYMAEQEFRIPVTDNISTFAGEVQEYSDYLERDIREDAFYNDRYYRGVVEQEVFRDASYDVHYAVLYSTGLDGCWGNDGVVCSQTAINTNVTNLLGTNPLQYEANFKSIDVPEGDFLIKFTDRDLQRARYKKTTERLKRLTEALVEYGQLKRYQGIADGVSPTVIFFPPSSGPISDNQMITISASTTGVTGEIETELDDLLGNGITDVVLNDDGNIADKEDRRLSMIALTRVLGLPAEFCCNAMRTFIDTNGERQEEGFFYYSNPRARVDPSTNNCRPGASTIDELKLPPRITVDEDPCGK